MLSTFFATADRDVERFCATLTRMGAGGVLVWGVMLYGAYCTLDMIAFVTR